MIPPPLLPSETNLMNKTTNALVIGLSLFAAFRAEAQVSSGVMTVTGAEMH